MTCSLKWALDECQILLPNVICFQKQKQLATLNNIRVLIKSILTELRGGNLVHAKTSLRAPSSLCMQFLEPCLMFLILEYLPVFNIN